LATSRILLISNTNDTAVADGLRAAGHETILVADAAEAIASGTDSTDIEVVVLDLSGPVVATVEAMDAIRAAESLTAVPVLCVLETDEIEDRIRLLEGGADDVIARPFDPRELDARAEALALRLQRSRDMGQGTRSDSEIRDGSTRRTVVLFSPKGGVGTTTIAVNVATALAQQVPGGVALLDLDFQFGQVATHLNMTTRLTMAELVRDPILLRDTGQFQASLDRHGSGLLLLAAPATPDLAARVTQADVEAILTMAASAFQIVVVDAGSWLDARAETALAKASDVVIVVTPEFPALKAVHALGELLSASGGHNGETSYVLNEIFSGKLLKIRDIEDALGTSVAQTIPYDGFAFLKSVNEGVPVVQGSPRTAAAEQLRRLATRLGGVTQGAPSGDKKAKGLGGLFSRN